MSYFKKSKRSDFVLFLFYVIFRYSRNAAASNVGKEPEKKIYYENDIDLPSYNITNLKHPLNFW